MSANALLSVSATPLAVPGGAGSSRATETGDDFAALVDAAVATDPSQPRVAPAKPAPEQPTDEPATEAVLEEGLADATLPSLPVVQPAASIVAVAATSAPISDVDAPGTSSSDAGPAADTILDPAAIVAAKTAETEPALALVQARAQTEDAVSGRAAGTDQLVPVSDSVPEPAGADRPVESRTASVGVTSPDTELSRRLGRAASELGEQALASIDAKNAAAAIVPAKADATSPTSSAIDTAPLSERPLPAHPPETPPASTSTASALAASLRALDTGATLRAASVAPAPVPAGKSRLTGLIADAPPPTLPVPENTDGSPVDAVRPRAAETGESPREIIAAAPKTQGDGKTTPMLTPEAAPSPKQDTAAKPDGTTPALAKPALPETVAVAAPAAPATAETAEPVLPGGQAAAPTEASIATPHHTGLSSLARATIETTALLAGQITRRLEARSSRFELALTPEGLGRVEVSMEIDADGQMAARLVFDNPLAATELRGRADELRRQLEDAGFTLARDALEFADRDPSSGGNAFDRRQNRAHAYAHRAAADLETDMVAAAPRWSPLSQTPQGVDMKV